MISDIQRLDTIIEIAANWVEQDPLFAGVIIILIIALTHVLALFSATYLTFVAFVYCKVFDDKTTGFLVSTVLCFVGCMLGMAASFYIGRNCLRKHVTKLLNKHSDKNWVKNITIINEASFKTNCQSIQIVFCLRTTMFPCNIMNYIIASLTTVEFAPCMVGNSAILLLIVK